MGDDTMNDDIVSPLKGTNMSDEVEARWEMSVKSGDFAPAQPLSVIAGGNDGGSIFLSPDAEVPPLVSAKPEHALNTDSRKLSPTDMSMSYRPSSPIATAEFKTAVSGIQNMWVA